MTLPVALSRARYVAILLLLLLVSYKIIDALAHPTDEISVAQSTKQASAAWALERSVFPQPVPVYRPIWMPVALRAARIFESYSTSGSPPSTEEMDIRYCADTCDTSVTFTLENAHGTAISSSRLIQTLHPDWTIPLRIGALAGEFISTPRKKPVAFVWHVGPWRYSAQLAGVDLSDFLRVVAGLQPV